ncbi:hypothetical protein [Aquimarina brevivitae]|uniref:Lipoprotein n=1 Tax=Aquimarina brevivitae TaxID=323412 RepID=A0A4Q7PHF4_9FLAO|nr:hypothetical protein [Aquimarina brevivitae]RZT00002.1 hypothetical protein EV197_1232 [Aquimarina brevivitae]
MIFKIIKFFWFLVILVMFSSCFSNSNERRAYQKTPLDNIITQYIDEPNFSVILADMDYDEAKKEYRHKYRILIEKPKLKVDMNVQGNDTVQAKDVIVKNTEWKKVSDIFFDDHINDLGMTILSKKNGVLDKKSAPAGYDNYVGNERYGSWRTHSSGGSFWVFYGQYRFLSDLFYGPSYTYYRSDYRDYNRNYRGSRSFYGSGDRTFGTNSDKTTKNTTWKNKSSAFRSKVRTSVKRSATTSRSRSYRSGSSYSKTSRNSSRYSRSSSRSRSGGFGK